MILVGLTGKAGAGKDTVADRLVEKHGFEKRSFAGPLKEMLRTLDPILDDQGTRLSHVITEFSESEAAECETHLKAWYPEYRRLLQLLGTDCIRAVDEDFWVKAAMKGIANHPKDARVVFSDVRFPNEAWALMAWNNERLSQTRTAGTELWHITRPLPGAPAGSHSSEQWAGGVGEDVTIPNEDSVDALYQEVDREAHGFLSSLEPSHG